jgi:hypothetical protein
MKEAAELIAETLTTEELLKTREWCTSREAQKPWYGEYGDSPKMLTKCAIMVALIDEVVASRRAADYIETLEARVATLSTALEEYRDTYVDEKGNTWNRPTAWAYFAACRTLDKWKARAEVTERAGAALSNAAFNISRTTTAQIDAYHLLSLKQAQEAWDAAREAYR